MRARLVSESVRFERGQDPKTAMGIGILQRDTTNLSKLDLENYYIAILPFLFPDMKDPKELLSNRGSAYLNTEATNIVSDFWMEKSEKYGDNAIDFNPYEFYSSYVGSLYPDGGVYENVNFERGKDPKSAMGVGILNNLSQDISDDPEPEYDFDGTNHVDPASVGVMRWAVENNRPEYIQFLLEKGANPYEFISYPRRVAESKGYEEIVKILEDWMIEHPSEEY